MDVSGIIIQLVSGALGGYFAGTLFKKISLGVPGNMIVGLIGGAIGVHVLRMVLGMHGELGAADWPAVVQGVAGGGVGGSAIMMFIGSLKKFVTT
ncbi:MAG: hypothetical protein ACK5JT_24045 [Hyphomicrobiaceae bacterium]